MPTVGLELIEIRICRAAIATAWAGISKAFIAKDRKQSSETFRINRRCSQRVAASPKKGSLKLNCLDLGPYEYIGVARSHIDQGHR